MSICSKRTKRLKTEAAKWPSFHVYSIVEIGALCLEMGNFHPHFGVEGPLYSSGDSNCMVGLEVLGQTVGWRAVVALVSEVISSHSYLSNGLSIID